MQSNFPADTGGAKQPAKDVDKQNPPKFVTRSDGEKFPVVYKLGEMEMEELFNKLKDLTAFANKHAIPFIALTQVENNEKAAMYAYDSVMPGARCGDLLWYTGKLTELIFNKEKQFKIEDLQKLYLMAKMMVKNNGDNRNE